MKILKETVKSLDMFGFPVTLNFDRNGNTY